MAGFFGLFGGKDKAPQSKEPFFLSEDEAKTYGNIDFMRKEVVVRRTFAKKKGQAEEMESVKSISSSTSKKVGEAVRPATTSFGASSFAAPAAPAPTPAAETPATPAAETPAAPAAAAPQEPVARRTPDTSMDMFRNMAKKMRR